MSEPEQSDHERLRAAPNPEPLAPRTHCSDTRAQLITHGKEMELHRTGLWDIQGRWGVHFTLVLRSGCMGEVITAFMNAHSILRDTGFNGFNHQKLNHVTFVHYLSEGYLTVYSVSLC